MGRTYPSRPLAAVAGVVVRDGRVLLVRRARPPRQGQWTLPGGLVELGEGAREALAREVREECGLRVEVERVLEVVDLIDRDEGGQVRYHYLIVEFLARYRAGRLRAASDSAAARWVPPAELAAYPLSDATRRVLRLALPSA